MGTETLEKPIPKFDALGHERRLISPPTKLEVRTLEQDAGGAIGFTGHAAVFDSETLISGWIMDWKEEIARGAFRKTIPECDCRFLWNHDPNFILGRNRAGTLRLKEDDIGLLTDADMAPTTYGKDVAISIERGDTTQMSFAFEVVKEEWDWEVDPPKRTIQEVRLWDVSVVTYPAFVDTDASLRSVGFEQICRSLNLDKKQEQMFLRHLATGHKDPQFAPTLEAAGEALRRLARSAEPAVSHSDAKELIGFRRKLLEHMEAA